MPSFEAIATAGGWVVCVSTFLGIFAAIVRGQLVAGHVHRREVRRGDRLQRANGRLTRRIATLERSLARKTPRG